MTGTPAVPTSDFFLHKGTDKDVVLLQLHEGRRRIALLRVLLDRAGGSQRCLPFQCVGES